MYEIYVTNLNITTDSDKLPTIENAVKVTSGDPILIFSDSIPSEDCKLAAGSLTMSDNASGSLEVTLSPYNKAYSILKPLMSEVKVVRDGQDIWYGRLLTIEEDFWKQKKCVFEGELSYLVDSLQTPQIYEMGEGDIGYANFIRSFLRNILAKHNGAVESYKRFTLGSTPSDGELYDFLSNTGQLKISTNFENTLDVIKQNLLDSGLDIHVKISHTSTGEKILDFVSGYTPNNASMQTINFGENLLDYTSNVDGSMYYTAIYPRGSRIEREIDDKNAEYIPTIDTEVKEDVKYYERVLDYKDPEAEHKNLDVKDTYRYVSVSPNENDNPHLKGWYIRYDYFRSSDVEGIISNQKTYYTRSQKTQYGYQIIENLKAGEKVKSGVDERGNPVYTIKTINPYEKGWFEKNRALNIDYKYGGAGVFNTPYTYVQTQHREVIWGTTYYKFKSDKTKALYNKYAGDYKASEFRDPKSKLLSETYKNHLFRSTQGFYIPKESETFVNGKDSKYSDYKDQIIEDSFYKTYIKPYVKYSTVKEVRAGDYILTMKIKKDDKDIYVFYAFGSEVTLTMDGDFFEEAVPTFYEYNNNNVPIEINPRSKGWYTIDRFNVMSVAYSSNDNMAKWINPDGTLNPHELKGSYVKTSDTKVTFNKPFFLRVKEKVIAFTKVNNVKTTDNPYKLKWYELLTDKRINECVSLIGAKSGTYKGAKIYVDGQNGRMYNLDGLNKFGYIYNVIDFDGADKPTTLLNKAAQYFKDFDYNQMSFEVSVLDLHYLNPNIKSLELYEKIYCRSEPHGLNVDPDKPIYFPVTEVTIDLLVPENTKYTLNGFSARAITKSVSSSDKNFNKFIDDTKVFSESSVLESARRHADDLIQKSIEGSYAGFIYNYDRNITVTNPRNGAKVNVNEAYPPILVDENNASLGNRALGFRVANAPTDDQATGKWEWFAGGLGYYDRLNVKSPWSSPKLAMTMDGHIVCDLIDTGTLRLSGSGSKDTSQAHLEVYDANGTKIGKWDKDGIHIGKGSITLGKHYETLKSVAKDKLSVPNFEVTSDGKVYAYGGVFTGTLVGEAVKVEDQNGKKVPLPVDTTGKHTGNTEGQHKGSTYDVTLDGLTKLSPKGKGIQGNNMPIDGVTIKNSEGAFNKIKSDNIGGVFYGSVYIGQNKAWDQKKDAIDIGAGFNCVITEGGELRLGWHRNGDNSKYDSGKQKGRYKGYWNFKVDEKGVLTANEGVFRGTLEANDGFFKGSLRVGKNSKIKKLANSTSFSSFNSISVGSSDYSYAFYDPDIEKMDAELDADVDYDFDELDVSKLKAMKGDSSVKSEDVKWAKDVLNNPGHAANYNLFVDAKTGALYIGPPKKKSDGWKFQVSGKGALKATKANIQGTVKITSGWLELITTNKKTRDYKPSKKDKKRFSGKSAVVISHSKIMLQSESSIQFCRDITDPDKRSFGISVDKISWHDRDSNKHVEVDTKWLFQAAKDSKKAHDGNFTGW